MRKEVPEYVFWIKALKWTLSPTLLRPKEVLLISVHIIRPALRVIAQAHICLRKLLESLLRVRGLVLVWVDLQ